MDRRTAVVSAVECRLSTGQQIKRKSNSNTEKRKGRTSLHIKRLVLVTGPLSYLRVSPLVSNVIEKFVVELPNRRLLPPTTTP